jgi:ATP-binding cassette subfamily B protein
MQAVLCAAAAGLVLSHVRRHGLDPQTLVLALWVAQLLGGGQRLAVIAGRDLPLHRSLKRRIEEPAGVERPAASGERPGGVAIGFAGLAIEIGGRALLHHLDLEIPAGQHVAILGRSGAGKSTLLGALLGWHRPAAGAVLADGRTATSRPCASSLGGCPRSASRHTMKRATTQR